MVLEGLKIWASNVYLDYRTAVIDVGESVKKRPKRAAVVAACLVGLGYLIRTNPSSQAYVHQILESQNDFLLISNEITNEKCLKRVNYLVNCVHDHQLRRLDLGFFSLMFRIDPSNICSLYSSQCKYLKPTYREYLTNNLLDIGIAGKWRLIDHQMRDFDVNPDEWQ